MSQNKLLASQNINNNNNNIDASVTNDSPSVLALNNTTSSLSFTSIASNLPVPEAVGIPIERNSASILRNTSANSSLREQKKSYNLKKRYFSKNIQSAIESTQEVHSGWLKARTTFKRWTKVWCQVKPGYLLMYTSQEAQKKYRLGVLLLSVCQVIMRPTKKEGFCFKLINPFGCSVWAKSSTRALAFSQASLTLRASDESIGKLWLDALHRCNLSANLDGYQPVIDEIHEGMDASIQQLDQTASSDSDDGEGNPRQLDGLMLNGSASTSNTNSIASFNNNDPKEISNHHLGSGVPFMNGNALVSSNPNLVDRNGVKAVQVTEAKVCDTNRGHTSSQLGMNNNRLNDIHIGNSSSISRDFKPNKSSGTSGALKSSSIVYNMNSTKMVAKFSRYTWKELQLERVGYVADGQEELGSAGVQSEEVHDSNKNFLWHIIKQLRPGMDLSKVTLPTFILEPRSFLEKLADYYYHCDILSDAVLIDDPSMRLINIVKWYLSGFYKKPKGPKKPYNPLLGERFRCFWDHPKTQSRTFFIAEQVSHHPPISAFHVSNRKDGFTITCALLSRSKFGGNSVSAILDGKAKLYLSKRNETYTLTMPYANCRGILLGSLCLELGGRVDIECIETGCKCELDFKLAPVWASSNSYNTLTGKILKSNKVTHTLDGHWDKKINITDKHSGEKSILWEVTDAVRNSRLKRYTVSISDQDERESVRLWSKVTEGLMADDQTIATAEKTRLEDIQRREARERKGAFVPDHFGFGPDSNEWSYRWQDNRAWSEHRDIMQFEEDFKIRTLMMNPSVSASAPSNIISSSLIPTFNPTIDLPLTQLKKFSEQLDPSGDINANQLAPEATKKSTNLANKPQRGPIDTEAIRFIESKYDMMSRAIKQVTETNRKLEEDVANLKRGKKTAALIMAAIVVPLLSWLFGYFS